MLQLIYDLDYIDIFLYNHHMKKSFYIMTRHLKYNVLVNIKNDCRHMNIFDCYGNYVTEIKNNG